MKRKLVSFLFVTVMLFTTVPTAFAASDDALSAADALHELGLFNGTGTDADGNPIYDLDRAPSRHEAVTMLVRLLGKETEAKSETWEIPFTDVADWAKPYVGYAYANGLTSGTSATAFGGNDTVTAAQYITFILRALGYESGTDFQWDKSWELADTIGLTSGEYSNSTNSFTRGDVAIISNNALSVSCKDGTTLNNTEQKSLGVSLQGYWIGENYSEGIKFTECYLFNGEQYSCAYRCVKGGNGVCVYTGYEEGTFSVDGDSIVLKRDSGRDYVEAVKQIQHVAAAETTYSVEISQGKVLLDDWVYQRSDTAEQTYNTYKDYVESAEPFNSTAYAYLAGSDFRGIRLDYPSATALCAYVYAYNNVDGELCVLTYVDYKIISHYDQFTLHNMTTGKTIIDPESYYDMQADRSWGATKLHYMDLSREVLKYRIKMLQALQNCLATGTNTWDGAYVPASELNL